MPPPSPQSIAIVCATCASDEGGAWLLGAPGLDTSDAGAGALAPPSDKPDGELLGACRAKCGDELNCTLR